MLCHLERIWEMYILQKKILQRFAFLTSSFEADDVLAFRSKSSCDSVPCLADSPVRIYAFCMQPRWKLFCKNLVQLWPKFSVSENSSQKTPQKSHCFRTILIYFGKLSKKSGTPCLKVVKVCPHFNERFTKSTDKSIGHQAMICQPDSRPQKYRNTVALLLAHQETITFLEVSTFCTQL